MISRAAIHEAGHAVIAELLGGEVESISIGGDAGGEALIKAFHQPTDTLTRSATELLQAEDDLQVGMGGALAEAVYFGEPTHKAMATCDDDLLHMLEVTGEFVDDDEATGRYLLKAGTRVLDQFERPEVWAAVEALAGVLEQFGKVSGYEVRQIVRRFVPHGQEHRPPAPPRPTVLFAARRQGQRSGR